MTRPTPKTVPWDRDYWANGEKGILSAQRCQDCNRLWYYPKPVCPTCMSENFIYEHLSGAGEIYTFSIVRRPENPSFVDEAPYAFIDVRLDEGIRLLSRLADEADAAYLQIGDRVQAEMLPVGDGTKFLPYFRKVR